jgi:hypothetical protein
MPSRLKTALLAAVLLAVNIYVCRDLFRIEYLRHMWSIEASFIGISRYAMSHWRDLSWFSLWYDGIPYQNTYPPLLHLAVAFVARIGGISAAHAYHAVTAAAYCLGPVAVFALALRLSASRWAAFVAGAIYSTLSLSAWLVPAIREDLGSMFYPRRLQTLVFYGEGPHVSSLALLPLALLFVDIAMKRRRAPWIALAAIFIAAAVLTNWLAAFALALLMASYTLARYGSKEWRWRDLGLLVLIGAAAYGIAMPLVPPSTIAVIQKNAQTLGGDFRTVYASLPKWIAAIAIAVAGIKIAIRRLVPHLQLAILFAFLTSVFVLVDAWARIPIVPQPARYHLEMEMALAILIGFLAHAIFSNRPRWVACVAVVAMLLAMIQPVRRYRNYARNTLIRPIDITTTSEWKTAAWLNRNWTGERVMLPGSSSYWLNAFSDVPQLGGGFDQGVTDFVIRVAFYGIWYVEKMPRAQSAEIAIVWLKALGAQAVGVTGPGSTEAFKPFRDPQMFEGVLEPLWRDGGDVVYRVGRARESLARVVPRAALVAREPYNGIDVDPLRPYVAALDDPSMPRAQFEWMSARSARTAANLAPGQVISLQMAWHRGWRAASNGRAVPIGRDAIGMMVLDPGPGAAAIDLIYDGGSEMRIAKIVSGLTLVLLVIGSLRRAPVRARLKS